LIEQRLCLIEKTRGGIAFGSGFGNVFDAGARVQEVEPPFLVFELRGGNARVAPCLQKIGAADRDALVQFLRTVVGRLGLFRSRPRQGA
jgi:hypothetical protein